MKIVRIRNPSSQKQVQFLTKPKKEKTNMFSKNKKLLFGILVISSLYGCKTQNSEVFVEEIKTYADPSVTIEVQKEENFQIALASNPTTGYGWEFETNPNLISLINQTFKPESDLIGAGGTETFKFSALNEGEAKIVFSYKRSWEEEVIEKKVFQVKIQ